MRELKKLSTFLIMRLEKINKRKLFLKEHLNFYAMFAQKNYYKQNDSFLETEIQTKMNVCLAKSKKNQTSHRTRLKVKTRTILHVNIRHKLEMNTRMFPLHSSFFYVWTVKRFLKVMNFAEKLKIDLKIVLKKELTATFVVYLSAKNGCRFILKKNTTCE